ncbi:MAG: MFS transporter [Gammaproteobacteria bacterium]
MSGDSQFSLLRQRRFGPFFLTQFLGAFNDNFFRNALVILIAFQGASLIAADSDVLVNLGTGLFILPFFLFSATAGQLADKFDKGRLIRGIKMLEIAIMLIAAGALYSRNMPLLLALLFLMGTQSALFAPVKYAILPQHLKDEDLIGGNGLVEMGTFVAILLGMMSGGSLAAIEGYGVEAVAVMLVVIAVAGYLTSRWIPAAQPVVPELRINWNPVTETWRILRTAHENRTVFLSILGVSWFWFVGATFLTQLPNYTRQTLGGNEQVFILLLIAFSVGIAVGSLLCERLSGRKVELGLVPFGSIGITVFGVDVFFAVSGFSPAAELYGAREFLTQPGSWRLIVDLTLVGLFGGFYSVPLYALIQQRSPASHRSRIIAGNSILNSLLIVVASLIAIALLRAGLTISQLFLVTALFNAVVAVYIYTLVPEFLMRFIVWLLIHTIYRVEKSGLERIPQEGPAVLVCNHVSFVDALVIAGCCRRPLRFVMYYRIFSLPILSFVFRTAKAIPIASAKEDAALLESAYDAIAGALEDGHAVCIFPEGAITSDGEVDTFRPGIERIIERNPVPVVPLALRGLWRSSFSRNAKRWLDRVPWRLWMKIGLAAGEPVPAARVSADGLRDLVLDLRGDWR